MTECPGPVDELRGLIGDMACGLAVGGNDDENLRHYHERLIRVAVALDDYLGVRTGSLPGRPPDAERGQTDE